MWFILILWSIWHKTTYFKWTLKDLTYLFQVINTLFLKGKLLWENPILDSSSQILWTCSNELASTKEKKNPKTMENNNVMIPFRVFFTFKIHFGINEDVCLFFESKNSSATHPNSCRYVFKTQSDPFFLRKKNCYLNN